MGARIPGGGTGLIPPKLVDQLIEAQRIPIKTAEKRKELIVAEKDEFQKLVTTVNDLEGALDGLRTKKTFYKLKVESSHPDIIDGAIEGDALPGTYEFEVRGLAKSEKELAYGFPDKNETPVGFGFMSIEREKEDDLDIVIDPGSTLQDVANKINDANGGVRAMVVNTKYKPESFRLLVISEKSGAESKINIDEDTTFLEFKEQVTGQNLDVLFEDVPVMDEDNNLDELIEGVTFNCKRSEPGTRVQVNITYDIDATLEGINAFVEKFNNIAIFAHEQAQVDPQTNKAGILSGDGTVRQIVRTLRFGLEGSVNNTGKFHTLADIGITTDPKLGTLKVDDAKVKSALSEDYDGVAKIFIQTPTSSGLAETMGERLKGLKDPGSGALKSRTRALERIIKNADTDIANRERMMEQKEDSIRRRFASLEGRLSSLKSQGDFLTQRFGGGNQE